MPFTQRFDADFRSVGAARRFAVQCLVEQGLSHLQDDVRTIVSELATNAVLHARTAFTVSLVAEPEQLRISVRDGSTVLPRQRRFGDADSATGRGLSIVAALSTAWGVTPVEDAGKLTWCELALRPVGVDVPRSDRRPGQGQGAA